MSDLGPSVAYVKAFGIATSGLLAGGILAQSYPVIPVILHAPASIAAKQWRLLFNSGAILFPSLAAISCAAYSFVAYHHRRAGVLYGNPFYGWQPYALAAALVISIVPITRLLMWKNIQALKAASEEKGEEDTVKRHVDGHSIDVNPHTMHLLKEWGRMNLARGTAVATGFFIALWASVVQSA